MWEMLLQNVPSLDWVVYGASKCLALNIMDPSHASDYFQGLSAPDKKSCTNKLTLSNGINLADPHSLWSVSLLSVFVGQICKKSL